MLVISILVEEEVEFTTSPIFHTNPSNQPYNSQVLEGKVFHSPFQPYN